MPGCNKLILIAALFLGWVTPAVAQTVVSGVGPAQGAAEQDFYVTAATKENTHPHFGEGNQLGFVVNGVQGRALVLARGKTYTFSINTGPMHDFYFSTEPVGWGTAPLTAGVKGNFTFKGVITFTPSAETPDTVYYACRNHQFMGGEIHIVNPGEEGKIKIVVPEAPASAVRDSGPPLDRNEVQQRLNFVSMYVNTSAAAKRVADSSNEEAKTKFKEAQDRLAAATAAFDANNLKEAKGKSEEAMSLMKEAAKFVPSDSMLKQAKSKYDELARGVADMESSYKQNREAIAAEGGKDLPKIDSDKIRRMTDEAGTLAASGKFDEANKILTSAMSELSGALNKLLANRNMAYEMKFATPDKEYEYELERYLSLERLIPVAIEQRQPEQSTLSLMETFVNKASARREQAGADARQKDFVSAIKAIKDGSDQLEMALKLVGIR